ncbi:MAG: sugar MFS transporter [Proteobacteria bacterium]|nr:MAG: sugar MFS transporter [Pseudomonadota bacterium]
MPKQAPHPTNTLALGVVSAVFFLWGFITCLNDILIPHLKSLFTLSYGQSALVQFTFFGAYFIFSLPAGKVVSRIGYQKSISLGLGIAALGALAFYPAASLSSFGLFLAALFLLAAGITFLQVAANPFVTLLGPEESAPSRLNLAQALNALGTTLAPAFGSLLILSVAVLSAEEVSKLSEGAKDAYHAAQAQAVQGPYLLLAAALALLAAFIYFFRLPSFTKEQGGGGLKKIFEALKVSHLSLGVLALFLYVGAEVSIGSFLINFIADPKIGNMSENAAAHYVAFYWGGAMVGRFAGAALLKRFDAGRMLGFAAVIAGALVLAAMLTQGFTAIIFIVAVGLFNSIMFPTIFSLGIRGLGRLKEEGASLLIMAIVGGAILPLAHGFLADQVGLQLAFGLPFLCYLYIAHYGFRGSRAS